jgi:hypothetical protein
MAQDEGDLLALAEVGEPVPCEGALDGYGDVLSIGSDEGEECIGVWREIGHWLIVVIYSIMEVPSSTKWHWEKARRSKFVMRACLRFS